MPNFINPHEVVKKRKGSVLVNTENIRTGILFKEANLLKNSNAWHGFILKGAKSTERNVVLKIVLDHLYPLDFVPVKFEVVGKDCIFMARNCTQAIEKLCKDNLMIPNPADPMSPISCFIILQYSTLNIIKVDVHKNILAVLHTLFNSVTKTLNLENFSENPELTEYCPLSQPKIMYFVLHIALGLHPVCIKLNNNNIHSLFPIEALWSSTYLTQLDLRNNKIDKYSSLETLKMLKLTDLWLDGNLYCNDLDAHKYVEEIKELLPKLERLDGVTLKVNGFPACKKNFLCDSDGFELVDQFLEYYFPLYDSDRKSLEGLYHPNAMCSLTNAYKTGQMSSNGARLRPYQVNSRNILCMADLSKSQQFLIKGNGCIVRKLLDLPRTEHDPLSFTVDLMYYSGNCAVVNVTGVYREVPDALLEYERCLGFCRTFVLTGSNSEFSITNDMLHVYNALTHQSTKAFSIAKSIRRDNFPIPITAKDKQKAIQAIQSITGVTKDWSKRLLENANYDIVNCIKAFMDLSKADNIPLDAFSEEVEGKYNAYM